jgi:hypothetical protein
LDPNRRIPSSQPGVLPGERWCPRVGEQEPRRRYRSRTVPRNNAGSFAQVGLDMPRRRHHDFSGLFFFGSIRVPAPPQPGETRVFCPAKSSVSRTRCAERSFVHPKRIPGGLGTVRTRKSRSVSRPECDGLGNPGPLRRISTLAWPPRALLPKRGCSPASRDSCVGLLSGKGDSQGKQNGERFLFSAIALSRNRMDTRSVVPTPD